jgi:LDH2 family malate/lactate/ureidoglycolate dehydrogenase
MDPAAEPSVVRETETTVIYDGNNGSGLYTAKKAMELAIEKAKQADLCRVSFVRAHHIGRLGTWAEMAAHAGCIGIITTGGGAGGKGKILPFGGSVGALGTNPIAVGFPTGDEAPFVLDYATSMIAAGKTMFAESKDADLPEGCIVDEGGNPSVKVADYRDGGHMLAFGQHKGYALSLLTCLLGGLSGNFDPEAGSMRGTFMQVMDVTAFTPLEAYQQGVRAFLNGIKATPPAPGFDEVLVPGDHEHHSRMERLEKGVEVWEKTTSAIQECADKLEVGLSDDLVEASDEARYQ